MSVNDYRESRMTVRARVRITLDIPVSDCWPDDVAAKQVRSQAIESAKQALRRGLVVDGLISGISARTKTTLAIIIGEPEVVAVIATLEDREDVSRA